MRLINADTLKIPSEEVVSKMAVAFAPTIDAVEVVRCEDCAHYGKDCVLLFPADGYCYDGERREDG